MNLYTPAALSWHIRWAAYEVATAYDGVEHDACPYGDQLMNEWAALADDPATAGQTEQVAGVFRAIRLFARRAYRGHK
jgi:hypothetical protein